MRPLSCRVAFAWLLTLTTVSFSAWSFEAEDTDIKEEKQERATAPPPSLRLYLADLSLLRLNPIGLETQNRLMLSKRLMDSDSLLFSNTFAAGGLSLKLNPAYVKVGPIVEFQPIAVFNVRAAYEYFFYFGAFGYLQSYENIWDDYSDAQQEIDEALAYSTTGHHVYIEPTVQMKVSNIAVRSKFAIEYWSFSLEGDDRFFYDPTVDTLVPRQGWTLSNDTDLLYASGGRITAGIRFSAVWPHYTEDDITTKDPETTALEYDPRKHMRVGPLVAYSLKPGKTTGYRPTVLAILGWYLNHPYRGGAYPYILVAYAFTLDFAD